MRGFGQRSTRGFTTVELMVTVTIIAVIAAVAIPRLGSKGRSSEETKRFANQIASELGRIRFQAIATKRRYRIEFRDQTTPSARPMGTRIVVKAETGINTNTFPTSDAQADRIVIAGNDALIWGAKTTGAPPSTPSTTANTWIQFEPTFRVSYNNGGATVIDQTVDIYVAGPYVSGSYTGPRYHIQVSPAGAVKVWGGDGTSAWN